MSILAPDYLMTAKMTRAGLICMLTLLVFATGCQPEKTPPGVLSKADYTSFLMRIYVAEAKVNTMLLTPDSAQQIFQPFEKALMLQYGSDSVIQKTYQYYLARPDELEQIYTAVIDSLNLREQTSRPPAK